MSTTADLHDVPRSSEAEQTRTTSGPIPKADPEDALSEEVHQLAAKIKDFSINELGELYSLIAGRGSLTPAQADFFLKKWKWEVVERLKIGDLPTSVRASIDIMNFGRSSDFDTSGNIWTVIEGSLESKKPPPCKGIVTCLAAGQASGCLPSNSKIQSLLSKVLDTSNKGLETSDWVLLLETLARIRFNPGTEFLLGICKNAQDGVIAGAQDGMPAPDVSFYIGQMTWAVVSLAPLANIPELVGPLLESLRAKKEHWTMPAASKLLAGLAYASALAESLLSSLGFKDLQSSDLDGETLDCLACASLSLPSITNYVPHQALLQALNFQKQKVASQLGNDKAKNEVSGVLSGLGINHAPSFQLLEGLLSIDIAIPVGKVALMLPPSSHFCSNMNTQPLGSTHLEWRQMSLQGWKVIAIPVSLWEFQVGTEQQIALLRKAIQDPPAIEVYHTLSLSIPRNLLGGTSLQFAPSRSDLGTSSQPLTSRRSSEVDLPESRQMSPSFVRSLSNQGSASTLPISPKSISQRVPSSAGIADSRTLSIQGSKSDMGSENRFSGPSSLHGSQSGNLLSSSQPLGPATIGGFPNFPHGPFENSTAVAEQLSIAERFASLDMNPQPNPLISSQGFVSGIPGMLPDAGMGQASIGLPPPLQSHDSMGSMPSRISADLSSLGAYPQLYSMGSMGSQMGSFGSQNLISQQGLPLASIASSPALGAAPPQRPGPSGLQSRTSMPPKTGDLRSLWQMVTQQVDPTQPIQDAPKRGVSVADLKKVIDMLPLETSAVSAVANRLAQLTPEQFAFLLTELARDNHAFRAWQLFDWVRALPEDNELRKLCDAHTYTTMISLCGPWQQVRRALSLVADMKQRSLQCGIQAYSALLNAAVKCGEVDLAVDVYRQMGQEDMGRDRHIFQTMVDIFVKMGRHSDALGVLDDMKASGHQAEVQLYNLIVLSCTKLNNPKAALDVYKRMAANGVQPNTKTFTALIGSVGKMSTLEQAMEIIEQLLCHEKDTENLTSTYSALMSACEKAGQWDLAVALFDKMSSQGCKPDVSIFNSMIAACAHGGEYDKARLMFDQMAEHGCTAEAVTYANLIRAYKKGGQWCHALDTFEAMQRSGCGPHAAVFSSIIDVLWQTGIAWAQAKALELFRNAVSNGNLAGAAESCKKGTLKVDLQALTVGVAVLSMASWLTTIRQALAKDKPGCLDSARKLAIVNGLGEHSRAQGHSAAVKEAVGAGLLGCKAPFRLVQDHSRSGRLESSTLALRKWLFSEAFDAYHSLIHGGPGVVAQQMMATEQYLKKEVVESEQCFALFKRIQRYETNHPVTFKLLHNQPGNYLALRKQLVNLTLQYALALQLSQETAHTALALMDRCVLAGMQIPDQLQPVLVCTCLRIAAIQESACLLTPYRVQTVTQIPATALEHMENTFLSALQGDTECISSVHCLKTYLQRLGVDLGNGKAVKLAAGCAFALATHALAELPIMQFTPSLTAAAVLVAARKAQGSVPFWPSVLSQMTGYTEASTPAFASAISHAERLCSKLCSTEENPVSGPESMWGGQMGAQIQQL